MYSEWVSLQTAIQSDSSHTSVLKRFPAAVSKEIIIPIVKNISQGLSINTVDQPSKLYSIDEVNWTMEVICQGLTLPFTEHDILKECVNIYCEWMSGCLIRKKMCVPKPVVEAPVTFSTKMLSHLYNLFVPREKSISSALSTTVSSAVSSALSTTVSSAVSSALSTTVSSALSTTVSSAVSSALFTTMSSAVSSALSTAVSSAVSSAVSVRPSAAVSTILSAAVSSALSSAVSSALSSAVFVGPSALTSAFSAGVDQVNRQAMLCHRALRMLETIAKESNLLNRELWEAILKFLLATTDTLLAPPREKVKWYK
ncbi:RALGAPB [Bugula neritina]|uniref:RALGAPB n=1 Tax=Bugula neritina TaxID=10212 RepID=A0A7J7J1P8_BUGNE|nr:RALGAPB [Bugula neritina]